MAGLLVAVTIGTSAVPVMAADTGKVTADVLRLRSGKSLTSSIIGKIPQNTTVTILETSGEWYKVSYDGKTGYVSAEYISVTSDTMSTGVVNATNLNVRKSGSMDADVVAKLKNGTIVNIVSKSGDWYYITSGSIKGYVSADYIKSKSLTGTVKADGGLNVRESASTSAKKVGMLENGTTVSITSASGDWYYIKSGNVKGYVFSAYVKADGATGLATTTNTSDNKNEGSASNPVKGNIFKCNVSSLRVRKSPSTDAAVVAGLVKGNQVTFVEVAKDKDWYKVTTSRGVTGYVAKEYLTYYSAGNSTSRGDSGSSTTNKTTTTTTTNTSAADKIIATAKKYLGVKYKYGGSSPSGFDCSGFTQYVFKQCGYSISRTSKAQSSNGTAVKKSDLKKGDLVFFSNSSTSGVGHVGIYIGGGQFIHSSSGKKYCVTISSLSDPYYVKHYKTARRILK